MDSFRWIDLQQAKGSFDEHAGWTQINKTDTANVNVIVLSREVPGRNGLMEFQLRGKIAISRDSYFSLNADMEYRPNWDDTCTGLTELSCEGPGPEAGAMASRSRVLHWEVKYPWPLGCRDYLLKQTVHTELGLDDEEVRCIQGRTIDTATADALRPQKRGIMRIEEYRSNMVIWTAPGDTDKASFVLLLFEDSKVSLPKWVVTKVAASTIPSQMGALVPVSEKYPPLRFEQMLQRFGCSDPSQSDHSGSGGDDDFFSASDEEGDSTTPPRSRSKPAKRGAGQARAQFDEISDPKKTTKTQTLANDDVDDLEQGLLKLGSDERELLLDLLQERRWRQTTWLWWCPCRKRRANKGSRNKL